VSPPFALRTGERVPKEAGVKAIKSENWKT
jgi:hypothetical protein